MLVIYICLIVQRGIPLERVQNMLRHQEIATTQRYAHLAPAVEEGTSVLVEKEERR